MGLIPMIVDKETNGERTHFDDREEVLKLFK